MTTSQPGWYADPQSPALLRYWDGSIWTQHTAPAPYQAGPSAYGWMANSPTISNGGTNGLAIASLVLGILWLYGIGSILALVFGYVALNQIKRRNENGRGLAIAGTVLGWIGVGGVLLIVIAAIASH